MADNTRPFDTVVPNERRWYGRGETVWLSHRPDAESPWRIDPGRDGDHEVLEWTPLRNGSDLVRIRLRKLR